MIPNSDAILTKCFPGQNDAPILRLAVRRPPDQNAAVMFPYVQIAENPDWRPGPYEGVELAFLHRNEATGGVAVLRRFKEGIVVPAHSHPEANEHVYILSGEWEESGVVYKPGTFFFAPKGVAHGPHFARTEVISLTLFDGPLTVVPA